MLFSPALSGEQDQNVISNTELSAKLLFCSQEVRTTDTYSGETEVWEERWLGRRGLFLPLGQARKHLEKSPVKKEWIIEKREAQDKRKERGMAEGGLRDFQKQSHRNRSSHFKEFLPI